MDKLKELVHNKLIKEIKLINGGGILIIYNNNPAIVYNIDAPLQKNYRFLKEEYFDLKNNVETLISSNKENETYQDKLNFIDMRVVKNDDKQFSQYEIGIIKRVENKLSRKFLLYEDQLNDVFELRKDMLELNKEIIDMETVGTVLNYLREFYKDLELDIEQNKKFDISFPSGENENKNYWSNEEILSPKKRYKEPDKVKIKNNNESEWAILYDTDSRTK